LARATGHELSQLAKHEPSSLEPESDAFFIEKLHDLAACGPKRRRPSVVCGGGGGGRVCARVALGPTRRVARLLVKWFAAANGAQRTTSTLIQVLVVTGATELATSLQPNSSRLSSAGSPLC